MADERLEVLRAEGWRVMALGQRLHRADWDRPSMCDAWTVSDVIGHLACDFDRYLAWLNDAKKGISDPPFERAFLTADNAMLLESFTGVPGPERLEAFELSFNRYLDALAGVDLDLPQGNPLGVMTVGEQLVWATTECAIHGWDVAEALDHQWPPPASLGALADAWRARRSEPLEEGNLWHAILRASGRSPEGDLA